MFAITAIVIGAIALMTQFWRPGATGIVHRIVDGDSFEANVGGRIVRVRIGNADSPEWDQPHGRSARSTLAMLMPVGTRVRLGISRKDRYGRRICKVSAKGRDVGTEMVRLGMAHGSTFGTTRLTVRAARRRVGLWQDPNPIHPAIWRGMRSRSSRFGTVRA